jgi:antitoxin PrlF
MTMKVTSRGQVTLPKAIREAAGIMPGDRVIVWARAEGEVVIEKMSEGAAESEYRRKLEEIARRRPIRGITTDEIMKLTRGED